MTARYGRMTAGLSGLMAGALLLLSGVPAWSQAQPQLPSQPEHSPPAIATPPAAAEPRAAPEPPAARSPRPIVIPSDPLAAKAFAVFDTHCARCHQDGRLKRPAPAAGFGNVLRLDEVAAEPTLVRPGNPDASRIYTHILRRAMPFDIHQEQAAGDEPSAEQMQAVRAWISALPPAKGCPDRRQITAEDIAVQLAKAGEKASWDAGRQRFVSLAHLHNACQSPEMLETWRQAVTRLLNSVSWRTTPIVVEPIDAAGTLLRIDIGDLGWVAVHWERIVQSGHNAAGRLSVLPAPLAEVFGTKTPVVRGDWLANTMLKAPLYYDLLGLPEIGPEIHKILPLDADALRRSGAVQRAAVKPAQFSRLGRLIERLQTQRGGLWSTYDAVQREGQRDPSDAPMTATVPGHDASLTHFSLPNGLPAFYVLNSRGERIDRVPQDIARRSHAGRTGVRVGLDCLGCHAGGPVLGGDNPKLAALRAFADSDRRLNQAAAAAVGLLHDMKADGVEPITALARQFTRPLTLERLAAELALSPVALTQLPPTAPPMVKALLRRLAQGLVSRAEVEAEFQALLSALQIGSVPEAVAKAPIVALDDGLEPEPQVEVLSDQMIYKPSDPLSLTVKSSSDCYLTVVSIDQRGRGTVIFPSDFEQNNFLSAGRELKLPGDGVPYVFRVRERGREQITAICSPSGGAVDGIRHDFERQRFTDLGDYATFLAQATAAEIQERNQGVRAAPAPDPRVRGKRGVPNRAGTVDGSRPRPESVLRSAITIEVR